MHLLPQFINQLAQPSANAKDSPSDEAVLPGRLRNYTATLPSCAAFWNPDQLIRKYLSNDLDRWEIQVHSYTPYSAPAVSEAPWPGPTAEHASAISRWGGNRQTSKAAMPHHLPLRACVLYRIRFIFDADIVGCWEICGGIVAQLSHFSIAWHIAATGAIGAYPTYDFPRVCLYGAIGPSEGWADVGRARCGHLTCQRTAAPYASRGVSLS